MASSYTWIQFKFSENIQHALLKMKQNKQQKTQFFCLKCRTPTEIRELSLYLLFNWNKFTAYSVSYLLFML